MVGLFQMLLVSPVQFLKKATKEPYKRYVVENDTITTMFPPFYIRWTVGYVKKILLVAAYTTRIWDFKTNRNDKFVIQEKYFAIN